MSNFLGLLLFFLPAYLIRLRIFGLPTTGLELLILVFLFVSLFKFTEDNVKQLKNLGLINWAAGLFVLAGIIATIVSPETAKALGQLKAFIIEPVLLFYAAILILKTQAEKKTVLRWLLSSSIVISLFGIVQYFTYINLPLRFWGTGGEIARITSVFDYPNALALYLAPLFVFFLTLWLKKFDLFKKTWVLPLGLISMAGAIILTFSRGAWLAILLALILLLLKQFSWKKWILPALIITTLLVSLKPVSDRIMLGLADPSSLVHWELMKTGINQITQSPFVGNGLHGFQAFGVSYPHNIFLNFWLEIGLLGLIAFALIIFSVSEQYKKNPTTLSLATSMFILVLILHGLVDVPYFKNDLSILFWFVVSLFYIPENKTQIT